MRWKQPSTRHKSRTRNNPFKKGQRQQTLSLSFLFCEFTQALPRTQSARLRCRSSPAAESLPKSKKDNGRGYSVQLHAHRHLRSESGGSHFCCSDSPAAGAAALFPLQFVYIDYKYPNRNRLSGRAGRSPDLFPAYKYLFRLFRRLPQSSQSRLPHQDGEQMPHSLRPRSSPVRWW